MAVSLMSAIETVGESGLQPLHADGKIAVRRFKSEVKMIAERTIRIEPPAASRAGAKQTFLEDMLGLEGSEDGPAIIAAIQNMINCSGIFDTETSGHNGSFSE